jgi:hypothetical protein
MLSNARKAFAGRRACTSLGLFTAIVLPLAAQTAPSIVGIWVGELKAQSQSLVLVINVSQESGELKATLDSPSQGAMGIPVSAISLDKDLLRVESKLIKAEFAGRLSSDGKKIDGSWSQGGASFPLVLEKKDSAPVQLRPQDPKPPFPYKTEEVAVPNRKAGVVLAGTLTIPAGSGPFPAVAFATGSGPQNRDEELLGHKPFLVIADYLARRGIVSLRCDDRGVAKSTGDFAAATTIDFADDVEAALDYLASRPEAKKGAIGIVGHSEGGIIAPIVASRDAKVGFVVLLAGPGISGEELLYLQGKLIAKAQGASQADIADALAVNKILYGIAKGEGDATAVREKAKKAYIDWVDANPRMKADAKAMARQSADDIVAPVATPWFRAFLSLDPATYLSKVRQPLLALDGSKDLQVPAKENLDGIRAALTRVPSPGANPKNAIIELPGLNHLFQHAKTGSPSEYGKIEETIAPEALKAIGDFILSL